VRILSIQPPPVREDDHAKVGLGLEKLAGCWSHRRERRCKDAGGRFTRVADLGHWLRQNRTKEQW